MRRILHYDRLEGVGESFDKIGVVELDSNGFMLPGNSRRATSAIPSLTTLEIVAPRRKPFSNLFWTMLRSNSNSSGYNRTMICLSESGLDIMTLPESNKWPCFTSSGPPRSFAATRNT